MQGKRNYDVTRQLQHGQWYRPHHELLLSKQTHLLMTHLVNKQMSYLHKVYCFFIVVCTSWETCTIVITNYYMCNLRWIHIAGNLFAVYTKVMSLSVRFYSPRQVKCVLYLLTQLTSTSERNTLTENIVLAPANVCSAVACTAANTHVETKAAYQSMFYYSW